MFGADKTAFANGDSFTLTRRHYGYCIPLVLSWCVLFAYAYPGYMNFDSSEQIFQGRTHQFSDWHPPLMAAYWSVLDYVFRGPLGMLVLQSVLFLWGLYRVLRVWFRRRKAAWVASALLLFPPIFAPMAMVWKDSQMAAFLVAGLALALRPSWRARALGLFLWFLAAGVRDNGIAAIPLLLVWVTGTWWGYRGVRRAAVVVGVTIALFAAATGANRALTRRHEHPWSRSIALMDIVGTIRYAEPISDDELRRTLAGTTVVVDTNIQQFMREAYTPRVWFGIQRDGVPPFREVLDAPTRAAVRRAWWSLVTEHPRAYVHHRVAVMCELLGLTRSEPWEPVPQSFGATPAQIARTGHQPNYSRFQLRVGRFYLDHVASGPLFRPWLYAVVALMLLGDALRRRDAALAALLGSGLLYEASFFVGAAAPDFRYSHWMVLCTCIAIVGATVSRYRRALTGTRAGY